MSAALPRLRFDMTLLTITVSKLTLSGNANPVTSSVSFKYLHNYVRMVRPRMAEFDMVPKMDEKYVSRSTTPPSQGAGAQRPIIFGSYLRPDGFT